MTQYRKDPAAISNYFDGLTRGLGKRDSSFTDIDAVTHDKDTTRFLFQEFKQEHETLHPAQRMVLRDLAGLPRCTVWFVRRVDGGLIGWAEFGSGRTEEIITESEYQKRYRDWWTEGSSISQLAAVGGAGQPLKAAEIQWGRTGK